jgi:hypothetical protein
MKSLSNLKSFWRRLYQSLASKSFHFGFGAYRKHEAFLQKIEKDKKAFEKATENRIY